MAHILIIDDEVKLRNLLARILRLEGFEITEASGYREGLRLAGSRDFDLVLCDVKLPDGNGLDWLSEVRRGAAPPEVILLTAYGTIPDGVQAIKNGAFDYITKGDDNNKIIPLIYKALEKAALSRKVRQLEKRLDEKYSFESILGTAPAFRKALDMARRTAASDVAVLLNGETGTGKEVFAQSVHNAGPRRLQAFVAVNCSAFSRDLLESQMFGYKAGAFTGAVKDTRGLFEEAHKGTLFLDEIGEMSPDLQAKLLRVLESGDFIKVGDTRSTRVDVRIIAATHRDLRKEVEEGRFREDLYYRLSVIHIVIPPLRERKSDISMLAEHFAAVYAHKVNAPLRKPSADYLLALQQHAWPGNIRELKNVIERSVILENGPELSPETLPFDFYTAAASPAGELSAFSMAAAEKLHIQKVLNYTGGNKAEAARLLQIGISTLYRKIDEYGI
ncbi:MAG: sigma-54-dependent transcriptional regulator [Flavobacteriales bacterium]